MGEATTNVSIVESTIQSVESLGLIAVNASTGRRKTESLDAGLKRVLVKQTIDPTESLNKKRRKELDPIAHKTKSQADDYCMPPPLRNCQSLGSLAFTKAGRCDLPMWRNISDSGCNEDGTSSPTKSRQDHRSELAQMLEEASAVALAIGGDLEDASASATPSNTDNAGPTPRRRRAQRRNSFVIHRKPGGGFFPSLNSEPTIPVSAPASDNSSPKIVYPSNSHGEQRQPCSSHPLGLPNHESTMVFRRMSLPSNAVAGLEHRNSSSDATSDS